MGLGRGTGGTPGKESDGKRSCARKYCFHTVNLAKRIPVGQSRSLLMRLESMDDEDQQVAHGAIQPVFLKNENYALLVIKV